jgi:hypothetical protein
MTHQDQDLQKTAGVLLLPYCWSCICLLLPVLLQQPVCEGCWVGLVCVLHDGGCCLDGSC